MKRLSEEIVEILREVTDGVRKAQAEGIPAQLPRSVIFTYEDYEFEVPIVEAYLLDGQIVTYAYVGSKKN